jgi:bacterioferritin (cytochrome b1)
MKKLAERHPEKLLDLLTERLTFERSGVKLYDIVMSKMQASQDKTIAGMIPQLKKQRDQEKEHEEWLEDQVRALGSDAHTETDLSELVLRESRGVKEVVESDDELTHLFHALLVAELVDENGWKLLVQLADEAEDQEALKSFIQRAREEEDHLLYIRTVVAAYARREILDSPIPIPASI